MDGGEVARFRAAALLELAAAALFLSSCSAEPKPSLVLVSLDTVRADRLGCYGSSLGLTPNLDELASRSVRFDDVTAAAPLTTPSHASLLTGTLPQRHGIRNNESFRLDDGVATLAETLQKSGYATGAFIGAFPLHSRFGLARGFDVYDEEFLSRPGVEERRAEEVLAEALEFIEESTRKGTPYFALVHLFDAHSPYAPPPPFAERHAGDLYGGEIAYLDASLGAFFGALRQSGRWDELVIAVVADHGESLGEHGENTHGALIYQPTVRIPWILKMPAGRGAGRRVTAPVRAIDAAPTLLGAVGAAPLEGAEGMDLTPFIERGDVPELPIYTESMYLHLLLGWGELRGLRQGTFKLIESPHPELYDLSRDPGESASVLKARPGEARKLLEALDGVRDRLETSASGDDVRVRERLSALGYLGGTTRHGAPASIDPREGMPIWREIEAAATISRRAPETARAHLERALEMDPENGLAMKMLGDVALEDGEFDEALRLFEAASGAGFRHPDLDHATGRAELALGNHESARAHVERFLGSHPESASGLALLGESLRGLGRPEEAETLLRRALALHPEDARLENELGAALAAQKKLDEARRSFQRASELDPTAPEPLTNLARLSGGAGAIELLERALANRADHVPALVELAKLLAAEGRVQEASHHAEAALAREPRNPEALFVAARVAELEGRTRAAAERYRRFLEVAPPALGDAIAMAKRRLAVSRN